MQNIYEEFSSKENISFKFKTKVVDVINNEDNSVTVLYIDVETGETISETFDKAVIGVGRSGHKLIENIKTREPKTVLASTTVDLGVRFELPNHIVKEINEEMYEFKVKLKTSAGYEVRTFCNNPSGYVTIEKYNDDEFVTVNGHSKVNSKTDNTNFAVLVTHSFTHPFNDPVGYGTHISKLSNILAGGKKVILQTYKDFKNSKRTKKLGRVSPTLDSEHYILGDLNLVFPSKTKCAIVEFLEQLNNVIPGVTCPDNLLYGVEVKFYSNVLDNNYFKNISFIGDCSGWSRSITYATCHGVLEAQKELENS
ncbi:NAD(P)/FAD-dependent oxidoreductase [bacterium]|nr:NAD(P)/FAD-dependent oxidoreductase [bacterium]